MLGTTANGPVYRDFLRRFSPLQSRRANQTIRLCPKGLPGGARRPQRLPGNPYTALFLIAFLSTQSLARDAGSERRDRKIAISAPIFTFALDQLKMTLLLSFHVDTRSRPTDLNRSRSASPGGGDRQRFRRTGRRGAIGRARLSRHGFRKARGARRARFRASSGWLHLRRGPDDRHGAVSV